MSVNGEVLLIKAPSDNQHSFNEYIATMGASVTLAENAPQALELAISKDFDLLLIDIDLATMNAKELLKGLLQLGFDTPVYGLTTTITRHNIEEYLHLGFRGILDAEFDQPKLNEVFKRHLSSLEPQAAAKNELSAKLNAKIAELKPIFLATLRTQYGQLNEHIEQRDYAQIIKILHVVKGSAGNFGYKHLTDIANNALISLRLEHFDEAPALIAKVIVCIDKILNDEDSCDSKN